MTVYAETACICLSFFLSFFLFLYPPYRYCMEDCLFLLSILMYDSFFFAIASSLWWLLMLLAIVIINRRRNLAKKEHIFTYFVLIYNKEKRDSNLPT